MKTILLCLCICLTLFSCRKDDPTPEGIFIRVNNASQYPFDTIFVNTSGGENSYGPLGAGQSSACKSFARAYRYAYIKIVVQGQELVWQPFDYVGETPLEPGRYTYVVDVVEAANSSSKQLTLRLEKR
jgi:hypothetical protein